MPIIFKDVKLYTLIFVGISIILVTALYVAYILAKTLLNLYQLGFTWLITKTQNLLLQYEQNSESSDWYNPY